MALDTLVWDDLALQLFFRSPFSTVGRDLARRAVAVESAAKVNASGRPGPNVVTGRLRSSISWRFGEDSLSMYCDIGSSVSYARYVEEGHPNSAHFFPKADGSIGYVSDHPTKAYAFLKPALAAAAL
jgi:hypothetical protein